MIENFEGYCKKYGVRNAKVIKKAFDEQKPNLVLFREKYSWGEVGTAGFFFEVMGKKIKIEVGNYVVRRMMNVTFVGIEGVNWTPNEQGY